MFFTKSIKSCITISEESDIKVNERFQEKLDFLGVTNRNRELTKAIKNIYLENHEEVLSEFVRRFMKLPAMKQSRGKISDEDVKEAYHDYLASMFEDEMDLKYVFKRRSMAELHEKWGIPSDWMIPTLHLLKQLITLKIVNKFHKNPYRMNELIDAFHTLFTIDQQLIVETYMESTASKFIMGLSEIIEYNTDINELKELLDSQTQQVEESQVINASMEELTASTEEIANSLQEMNAITSEKLKDLNKGIQNLNEIAQTLEEIDSDQTNVRVHVNSLHSKVESMKGVISFISEIAEQTNLLALNASIEAARAGENGKGFAVVAEEVRKLADHTKKSLVSVNQDIEDLSQTTENITTMVSRSTEKLHKGVEYTANVSGELIALNESLQKVGISINEISSVTEEQASVTDEVVKRNHALVEAIEKGEGIARKTGQAVYNLSKMIDKYRTTAISNNMKYSQEDLIQLTITDHLLWRWRVYNMILGFEHLTENDVASYTDCRLGKWYYGHGVRLIGDDEAYNKMEDPHILVHELAKKAVNQINADNKIEAEHTLHEIADASKEVIEILNSLREKMIHSKKMSSN